MFSIQEIETYYPEELRPFKRFLLREYLQYKILEIIFQSPFGDKLCFLGGTCLRIIHNNQRFSEDLDFDNFGLTGGEFEEFSEMIKKELEKLGYDVEIKNVLKGAYHCHIKFPGLLFQQGLPGYQGEKILIQLETEPQKFDFKPESPFLNKFDVFTSIFNTPLNLILSQKFHAILNRKRNKGRDFYDVVFLLGKSVSPNYRYLTQKLDIPNKAQLKEAIIAHCQTIDMKEMAADVEPFLFNVNELRKVEMFVKYFRGY